MAIGTTRSIPLQRVVVVNQLFPDKPLAEVEDFVDFLTVRNQERHLTQAATRLSEEAFRAVWDNSDDAEYDRL